MAPAYDHAGITAMAAANLLLEETFGGVGFRVQGLGFRVQGLGVLGFRV